MRYEKEIHKNKIRIGKAAVFLLDEYERYPDNVEKELTGTGRAELYTNLNKLIMKISDYICREEDVVRERLGETMGGKVLELESERLKAIGESIGEARGKAVGELQGENAAGEFLINRLILDGRGAEVQRAAMDAERRKELYKEYGM